MNPLFFLFIFLLVFNNGCIGTEGEPFAKQTYISIDRNWQGDENGILTMNKDGNKITITRELETDLTILGNLTIDGNLLVLGDLNTTHEIYGDKVTITSGQPTTITVPQYLLVQTVGCTATLGHTMIRSGSFTGFSGVLKVTVSLETPDDLNLTITKNGTKIAYLDFDVTSPTTQKQSITYPRNQYVFDANDSICFYIGIPLGAQISNTVTTAEIIYD